MLEESEPRHVLLSASILKELLLLVCMLQILLCFPCVGGVIMSHQDIKSSLYYTVVHCWSTFLCMLENYFKTNSG